MYIIWTDYGVEGWQPVEAADWDEAVRWCGESRAPHRQRQRTTYDNDPAH